jgi:chemotaxis protein methyltransferase CheR
MVDAVATNKTDFFREPYHFDFLLTKGLPELASFHREIKVWSAGCSTGEEPYTLAMVLSEFVQQNGLNFSILATDISTRALQKAKRAIYDHERIGPVPPELRRKYLLRGKGHREGFIRIKPSLRSKVQFMRLNLTDPGFDDLAEPVHIIFCRNVMIYFDPPTQKDLVRRFCRYLPHNGYLFTGHSESHLGNNLPLVQVAPTIHRRV